MQSRSSWEALARLGQDGGHAPGPGAAAGARDAGGRRPAGRVNPGHRSGGPDAAGVDPDAPAAGCGLVRRVGWSGGQLAPETL